MMKHTYATPAQVATNIKSVTHNWFGADALNWRFTKSGCPTAVGSGLVVFTCFDHRTPLIPRRFMSLAVWSRPISMPTGRADLQRLRTPYTWKLFSHRSHSRGESITSLSARAERARPLAA